ncbi:MAG: ectoine synthase [Rhodospirillaceae bacterium]|nr:ectoine synthase [Rhodospirillaceae bacterium]
MLIKKLSEIQSSERNVRHDGWESARLLLASDQMGFSFHITRLTAGRSWTFQYQHHLEAVYVISGTGLLKDIATGDQHMLEPGTLYALNMHDKHKLTATTELITACVFNPPVVGSEVHDPSGAYPAIVAIAS